MTSSELNGRKIAEIWWPHEGRKDRRHVHSTDAIKLEMKRVSHGDHDETWVVQYFVYKDGRRREVVWHNPRHLDSIVWENDLEPETPGRETDSTVVLDVEAAERIEELCMNGDKRNDHATADDILCELLKKLGCTRTVARFIEVGKWYA